MTVETTEVAIVSHASTAVGEVLSDAARAYAREAMAPGTRRSYGIKFALWTRLAEERGIGALPAPAAAVGSWLAELANTGRTSGKRGRTKTSGQALPTLRLCVAALRAAHRAAGLAFDTSAPEIALVLRGVARANAEIPAQAAPLKADVLLDVIEALGRNGDLLAVRDAALLATGYVFGRRASEVIGLDLDVLRLGDGILRRDAKVIEIALARHKSASDGEVATFVVPRDGNEAAVAAIERWVTSARIEPGAPLFVRIGRWGELRRDRLSAKAVSLIVRRRLVEHFLTRGVAADVAEREAAAYSGHSLWCGLAVQAAESGADLRAIQQALGHASPAMAARYSRKAEALRTSVHRLPGVGLGRHGTNTAG